MEHCHGKQLIFITDKKYRASNNNPRKMTMFATHAAGEVIDAIRPDLEAFTSLWAALRVNYEGTNITRTVARLLHMYQPEEGIIAYERLLRTLFVLLEDFDSNGLQLLVSMVPPPKGVTDEIVKEVFNRATGFVRVDAPIFHKNTQFFQSTVASTSTSASTGATPVVIPYPKAATQSYTSRLSQKASAAFTSEKLTPMELKKSTITCTNQNGLKTRASIQSPQINSQESAEVFRGFPPSEIHNTQSHVQNIKNFYRPPNCSYGFPSSNSAQSFVNFGQIIGQNSGRIRQPIGASLAGTGYRAKWFQTPYLVQKNSYTVPQYQDVYVKTADNQYVKVPATKMQKNFCRTDLGTPRASYQTLCENAHEFMRSRSNTVTSGLLEKVQQRRELSDQVLAAGNESSNFSRLLDADGSLANFERCALEGRKKVSEENFTLLDKKLTTVIEIDDNSRGGDLAIRKINSNDREPPQPEKNYPSSDRNPSNDSNCENENPAVNSEAFEEFAKEVRMRQRAIQEDIYKMDVVRCEEFVNEESRGEKFDINSIKPELLKASEELRISCRGFLERVKTEETVEVPILPRTRSLSAINEDLVSDRPSGSNFWRLLTPKEKNSPRNGSKDSADNGSPDIFSKSVLTEEENPPTVANYPREIPQSREEPEQLILSAPIKRTVQRRKKFQTATQNQTKNQRAVSKDSVPDLRDESISSAETRGANPDTEERNNSQPDSTRRYPQTFNVPQTASSSSSVTQVWTMADLAAYKKQYYDALLSIQKAKAAVSNSLAISSVGTGTGYDPYYYNYVQHHRQQILHRHQRQMIMGHRFSQQQHQQHQQQQQQQQSLPPDAPWFRASDWRYPFIGTSRLPQRPQMLHPSSSMWSPRVGFLARDSQAAGAQRHLQINVAQPPKPHMKRRKLEEIVGKLKESETNGASN